MMNDDNKLQNTLMEEKPTFIIERVEDTENGHNVNEIKIVTHSIPAWAKWGICLLLLALTAGIFYLWHRQNAIAEERIFDLPTNATSQQVIESLGEKRKVRRPKVTMGIDSINNVPFQIYKLKGLKMELSWSEPTIDDLDVYFYSRGADSRTDIKEVVDACVMNGEVVTQGITRWGYLAAVGNNVVLAVSPNDSVMNFVSENGGFFFRQFALVSAGQVGEIRQKGKAMRGALAVKNGVLYYVKSLNPESMYDFAEAIADYGFSDAVYMADSKFYSFWRDSNGEVHDVAQEKSWTYPQSKADAPFVVFRKIHKQK